MVYWLMWMPKCSGNMFDGMCLVQHDIFILGQHAGPFAFERQIAKQQGVIGHNNIGRLKLSPCPPVKTLGKMGALSPFAVAMFALHCLPDLSRGQFGQIAE